MPTTPIRYEQRFRTPLAPERSLGLWVDRIGRSAAEPGAPAAAPLRVLGLYAAVAAERGRGTFETLTAGTYTVAAGDVWLLRPGEPSRYYADGTWDTRWIVWAGEDNTGLEGVGVLSPHHLVFRQALPIVQHAWERLHELMTRQDRVAILARKIVLLELLHGLCLQSQAAQPRASRVQPALDWLNTPEGPTQSVEELARRVHMSPSQFRRLFRQQTGTAPKAFQNALRLTLAKEKLAAGWSIKETAFALGFTDEFHFMRVFRKLTGQTAGQFAAEHSGYGGRQQGRRQPRPPVPPRCPPAPACPAAADGPPHARAPTATGPTRWAGPRGSGA